MAVDTGKYRPVVRFEIIKYRSIADQIDSKQNPPGNKG
jgi:hypothetical protein